MATSDGDEALSEQYENYPYPPRDPAEEAQRLITGSPSQLDELNHYVFGGRRDFSKPFRALVAGGGTGDAAIMLAQQLAETGGPGEVIYLDLSAASPHAKCHLIFLLQQSYLGIFDYGLSCRSRLLLYVLSCNQAIAETASLCQLYQKCPKG